MAKRETYRKETNWGAHTVETGRGKDEGKFVAESWGWGGRQGYHKVFDTQAEAESFVDSQTAPLDPSEKISF